MQILNSLKNIGHIVIAIGFFDGVHIAHKEVILSCVNYARQNNIKSAIITFKDHPCISVWNKTPEYINTYQQRMKYIENLGIDYAFVLDFNTEICNTSAINFIKDLMETIAPQAIFTGYNFYFGKNKTGTPNTLSQYSQQYKYKYFMVDEKKINDLTISSTNIRNFIKTGEIEAANSLLGYNFSFSSKVIKGKQIGRTINFPTANLTYPNELVKPLFGVYAATVEFNQKKHIGIMNIGYKPTVDKLPYISTEVHILNFSQDIYNENLTILPIHYIRKQKKFDSLDKLKNQILSDISNIKI